MFPVSLALSHFLSFFPAGNSLPPPPDSSSAAIFRVQTLLQEASYKIACLDGWADSLMLADVSGRFHTFGALPPASVASVPQPLDEVEFRSQPLLKKAVSQLIVVESHQILLCISDATFHVLDLPSLQPRQQLDVCFHSSLFSSVSLCTCHVSQGARGCHLFAVNRSGLDPAVRDFSLPLYACIAVKRKLLLLRWQTPSLPPRSFSASPHPFAAPERAVSFSGRTTSPSPGEIDGFIFEKELSFDSLHVLLCLPQHHCCLLGSETNICLCRRTLVKCVKSFPVGARVLHLDSCFQNVRFS